MTDLSSVLAFASSLLLPLGIAAAGTVTTIKVSQGQNRARAYEREQDRRDHDADQRSLRADAEDRTRAEVLEGICEAFAEYAELASTAPDRPISLLRVRAELLKLSTRCDTEHLASNCIGYILDTKRLPGPAELLEVFSEIQGYLEAWHVGHRSVEEINGFVRENRQGVRKHLEQHDIRPVESMFEVSEHALPGSYQLSEFESGR